VSTEPHFCSSWRQIPEGARVWPNSLSEDGPALAPTLARSHEGNVEEPADAEVRGTDLLFSIVLSAIVGFTVVGFRDWLPFTTSGMGDAVELATVAVTGPAYA
jgi:hypothetical protein